MTTQRPEAILALSLPLYRWLATDAQWMDQRWVTKMGSVWRAALGSINARLSEALATQRAATQLHDPILIVGPWRSGTTVMHELLTAATGLPTPKTWQCMNPCAFQFANLGRNKEFVARPMDGLEIGNYSPQEDEFALLSLGAPSAYRAFLMPHRIGELLPMLEQDYWLSHPEWRVTWEHFLTGVILHATTSQPLILKSPNHTYRLRSILQKFPNTRLVWMARDAIDVFHSNQKLWQTMSHYYGLTSVDRNSLDDFLTQAMQAAAETLEWCGQSLPPSQYVVVSQNQLLADPAVTVKAVAQRLGIEGPINETALSSAISRTRMGRVDVYSGQVSAATAVVLARLDAVQGVALANCSL